MTSQSDGIESSVDTEVHAYDGKSKDRKSIAGMTWEEQYKVRSAIEDYLDAKQKFEVAKALLEEAYKKAIDVLPSDPEFIVDIKRMSYSVTRSPNSFGVTQISAIR